MSIRAGSVMILGCVGLSWTAAAKANEHNCSFPDGDKTSLTAMLSNITRNDATCALPWRALKAAAKDPASRKRLEAAYAEVAKRNPDRASAARARKADVAAAAGEPAEMLAIADANVLAHPEDKSLPNMSCFARGAYGFDTEHAMPFCNAAVDAGRPGWALVNRGRVELQLGRFKEAFADFNEALGKSDFRTHFMVVDAAYGRGIARLRLGDTGGRADIAAALKARPTIAADFADAGLRP